MDIGTENIKCILFTVEVKKSPNNDIIGKRAVIKGISTVKQSLPTNNITDIATIVRSAKEAIRQASQQAKIQPEQMVMGIAGEYIKGSTSTITYKREDPETKINVGDLRNIVHKLQWKAFDEIRKQISEETGFPEIDVKLVNSSIVEIRIDNYKVTNPLGFQGKEVQMSIFNSFAPLAHYGAMHNIANNLGLDLIGIIAEPFALSKCIDYDDGESSFIFLDIGGGLTDIAIVENGAVMGTKMFGIGGKTFTKRLSVELNISFEEAEILKLAYTEDKLEQKSKKIISDIINEDMEIWLEGVVLALSEFKDIETLPSKILLSGGGSYLPEFKTTLNTRKWYKKLHFARTPQTSYLKPQNLKNIIDDTKKLKDREYIMPMALINAGIELTEEENVVQRVLKKVIGIMKV